ncbi:MAG: TolB family protein [Anaerolineales bacterium]
MRRSFIIFIVLSLFLSACGTLEVYIDTASASEPAAPPVLPTAEPTLSLNSSSEEIQRAMLESATNWLSIWMDGTITQYTQDGSDAPPQVSREQVWIDLSTSRFRILTGPSQGHAERFIACDGMTILEMDLKTGQSQSHLLPEFAQVKQFVPTLEPGSAYPQPLWGQMGTQLSQLAFSSDFAQNEGIFKAVATEFVAGRETVGVEWTHAQKDLPSWRAWLDAETAVILKMQSFGKSGGETIQSEVVVNRVIYDGAFDESLFRAPATPPQFSDVAGNPLTSSEPVPTASSDPDPLREVYFFVTDHNYGNEKVQFVRVPGSCAAGLIPCPEAEVISPPFDLKFSLTSLIWSPNGDAVAFAYPISADGNRAALFLFDPEAQTWQSLAEFNFIDPPFWSPDGNWLAFRVQDGAGDEDIYVIRREGSQLTNLSASEKLPSDGSPYALSGWINNHVILHSRSNGTIYLLRPEDGSVTPLFDTPLAKSDLVVPSPDGYFLAYTEAVDQKIALKLLTPDGNTARELATLQKTSIYPIVWSPDSARLAFVTLTNGNDPTSGQDVYIVGSEGRGLQQVYHSSSASIAEIVFSSHGNYLLFRDDDAVGRHIFVVDLSTLEQHKLQVPSLPLDWWWLAPSWR